jgi:hypothetical protein
MGGVLSCLKKTTGSVLGPKRGERVRATAEALADAITCERDAFDLQRTLALLGLFREDIPEACDACYHPPA